MAGTRKTETDAMYRRLVAIAIALLFALQVAQAVTAAADAEMEASANSAADACTFTGGTASFDYVFRADGSLASIQVACAGGQGG